MDGNRRYADEPEPSWYTGQSPTPGRSGNPYESGIHERPSGAFRLPGAEEGGYPPRVDETWVTPRGPVYPAVRPTSSSAVPPAGVTSSGALPPQPATYGGGRREAAGYGERPNEQRPYEEKRSRARRPVSAFLIAAVTGVLLIPSIMLLIDATFGDGPMLAGGVVPAVLLILGLPLTGGGLYALAGGAPATRESWLRPPVAYLPIGLVLLLAAGLGAA